MPRSRVATTGLMLCVTMLCAAAAGGCTQSGAKRPDARQSRLVITEAELAPLRTQTIYEAIKKLRGEFLSYRGETSLRPELNKPYPDVFVNGTQYGDLNDLRNILASDVAAVRLLRTWEAQTKYGTGHPSGVIEITTK